MHLIAPSPAANAIRVDVEQGRPPWRRRWLMGAALTTLAIVFAAGHAGRLADAPDSVDTANFVLGLKDFNLAAHQPHPPGYPVYLALGRIARLFVSPEDASGLRSDSAREALALSALGICAGALAVFPIAFLFRRLDPQSRPALALVSAALVLASPIYWFTSVRPLSDVVGLAASMGTAAMLVTVLAPAWWDHTGMTGDGRGRRRVALMLTTGALLAGLTGGIRIQTMLQTVPLLVLSMGVIARRRALSARAAFGCGLALVAGILAWLIPLVAASGGVEAYLDAIRAQATDDVSGGHMFSLDPSIRAAALALYRTAILPWGGVGLGAVVAGLALLGAIRLAGAEWRRLITLAAITVPYALFSLLFQDSAYTRYALPIVPAMAWLAANGLSWLAGRSAAAIGAGLAVAGVSLSAALVERHVGSGAPAVRAVTDMREFAASVASEPRLIAMHHGVWRALRGERFPFPVLQAQPRREWLAVAEHWLSGRDSTVWFLASSRRTDLAFVDPASRRLVRSYSWAFDRRPFLGASRPGGVDWYELTPPVWFLTRGWSLTPEMAGAARAAGDYERLDALRAYVRRGASAATLLIGGRLLPDAAGGAARVAVTVDGLELDAFSVDPGIPFVRSVTFDASRWSTGEGRYAEVAISGSDQRHGHRVPLSLEQFEARTADDLLLAFGRGWHEAEYHPDRGELWRWSSRRAALHVSGPGQLLTLRVRGDVPARRHPHGLLLTIRIGTERVARFRVMQEFDVEIPLPRADLDQSQGLVWLETDRAYVPAAAGESADRRELGVRLVDVELRAPNAAPVHAWPASRDPRRISGAPLLAR
jgi:hypothetical protein